MFSLDLNYRIVIYLFTISVDRSKQKDNIYIKFYFKNPFLKMYLFNSIRINPGAIIYNQFLP